MFYHCLTCYLKIILFVWPKFFVLAILTVLLLACGDSGTPTTALSGATDAGTSNDNGVLFTVNKTSQQPLVYDGTQGAISLPAEPINFTPSGGNGDGEVSVSSSDTSVITATFNNETHQGTLTPVGAGTATITLSKAGDTNYLPANAIEVLFTVSKTSQQPLIYNGTQGTISLPAEPINFTPSGGNGDGEVSVSSSETSVITATFNNETHQGTLTPVGAGTATITLSKAGDTNYLPANAIEVLFTVSKASQQPLVYDGTQGAISLPAEPINFTPSGGNGDGEVSVSSSDTSVITATFNNETHQGTLTPVGAGTATITLSKAGDTNYLPANAIEVLFTLLNTPTNLTATAGDSIVNLNWTATASEFRIHRATESLTSVEPANYSTLDNYTNQDINDATQASITGLTNDTTYYFVVTTVSTDGNHESTSSNVVSATPRSAGLSIYPKGDIFPFGGYSSGDYQRDIDNGFTLIGPSYSTSFYFHVPGGREIALENMAASGQPVMGFVGLNMDFHNSEPITRPNENEIREEMTRQVRALRDNTRLAWWYLAPEELRWWRWNEFRYLQIATEVIRAEDPLNRPIWMYEPNHRGYNSGLIRTSAYLNIIGKGSYVNLSGYKDNRLWVRWSVEQETRTIEQLQKENGLTGSLERTPILVPQLSEDPEPEEYDKIPLWVRHDCYLGLVSGAKGVMIWSLFKRTGVRETYDIWYNAYAGVAKELTGELDLGRVFLFGEPANTIAFTDESNLGQSSFMVGSENVTLDYVNSLVLDYNGQTYGFIVNSHPSQAATISVASDSQLMRLNDAGEFESFAQSEVTLESLEVLIIKTDS